MKDGTIVESGAVESIIRQPRQDYTRKLIASQPSLMPPATHEARAGPALLALQSLSVDYPHPRSLVSALARRPRQVVKAVQALSLELAKGQTLGIVGESGSGKSTVARAIVGLAPVASGQIYFEGQPVDRRNKVRRREFQRAVQMVFQDPFTSLNPAYTVGQTLAEPLRQHGLCRPQETPAQVAELMRRVELPLELLARRTNQLSGGQRQRVGIARALALRPKLIIADEVTSALDVTIQAQILGLFRKLRDESGLSLILISHDLAVVRHLCERVAVMRGGELVEYGDTARIFDAPQQSYTRELLAAIPYMNKARHPAGLPGNSI
jgi:peptide/nickel transport system ATP-binding protein